MKLLLSASVAFLLLGNCLSQEDGAKEGNLRRQLIVGGEDAGVDRYPYYVGLLGDGAEFPYCGGTLIHDEWVLTAATCTSYVGDIVKIGLYNTETCFNGGQDVDLRTIKEVHIHPKYESDGIFGWNVALLKLSHPSSIDPVPYDDGCKRAGLKSGDPLDIVGFGLTTGLDFNSIPDTLQVAEVSYVTNQECQKKWEDLFEEDLSELLGVEILDNMMCAVADDKSPCIGDDGGPLVKVGRHKDLQVGVISFGPPKCELFELPRGYVRLGDKEIADFIYKTITGRRGRHRCGSRKKKVVHKKRRSS